MSDTQFGDHHRFGAGHDSLASRLIDDLRAITKAGVPPADLIVLSGDLAERGMADELGQARAFVDELLTFTGLTAERVVVVPGNHDVNWPLCQSHFLECAGLGRDPEEPYFKKWQPWSAFVSALHGPSAFTPERPYRLHQFDELGVVVAALNSTVKESHETHHGWCGEDQLKWFESELAAAGVGWLRLGVVHHNLRRQEGRHPDGIADEESLRDAVVLTRLLGPHLDLVLHGHTHDGRRDHLADGTLVLATGSAAVSRDWRPEEVGNQYQVLQVRSGTVTRWARRYTPRDRRWVGDTALSASGNDWMEEIPVPGIFVQPAGRDDEHHPSRSASPDGFIDYVAQVTQIDLGDAGTVERRRAPGDTAMEYLLVVRDSELGAVGAVDGPLDDDAVDAFDRAVHGRFRQRAPLARSRLVHTGPPNPDLNRRALARGIQVCTWTEYQRLLDLSLYVKHLREQWLLDPMYPQELYLEQRYRDVDRQGQPAGTTKEGLAGVILDWLLDDELHFGLVLGDAGFGKSFLVRRLTYLLLTGASGVVPVVLLLRHWEKNHTVVEMVSQTLAPSRSAFQLERFEHMFHAGRVVLLVDGYDEFAIRVGHDRAADQLATFLDVVDGSSTRRHGRTKLLLTTRPSHFRGRDQIIAKVFEKVLAFTSHRVYELEPFGADDQEAFLRRWFTVVAHDPDPQAQAARWTASLKRVNNLPELARTPRMLSFMARDLGIDKVEQAAQDGRTITAAGLYELLVGLWLATESDALASTTRRTDERSRLSPDDRWRIAEELALGLWEDQARDVTAALLERAAGRALDLPRLGLSMAQAAQEIGSRNLLVGEGERRRFAHQSVYEYLLARRLARVLADPGDWPRLGRARLSELTAQFLRDLAPTEAAAWIAAQTSGDGQ